MMAQRLSDGGHLAGRRHDGLLCDVGASVMRWLTGRDAQALPGESFLGEHS